MFKSGSRIRPVAPLTLVAALVAVLLLAGCGNGSAAGTPRAQSLPLAGGVQITSQVRRCDRGANPYCALQLVVVGHGYSDSHALEVAEAGVLKRRGWSHAQGQTVKERSAESANNQLRVTYATAANDLQSIDLQTIKRAGSIARALSDQMFARAPALSVMVQSGSG